MKLSRKWVIVTVILAAVILQVVIYRDMHRLVIRLRVVEPHLREIDLVNKGLWDLDVDREVVVTWDTGESDLNTGGLAGFKATQSGAGEIIFEPQATTRPTVLHPGEGLAIGWIRASGDPVLTTHFGD